MVQKSQGKPTWDVFQPLEIVVDKLPFPQLVRLPDFERTINSISTSQRPFNVRPGTTITNTGRGGRDPWKVGEVDPKKPLEIGKQNLPTKKRGHLWGSEMSFLCFL